MANSDKADESPNWLDVLGIDDLSDADQGGQSRERSAGTVSGQGAYLTDEVAEAEAAAEAETEVDAEIDADSDNSELNVDDSPSVEAQPGDEEAVDDSPFTENIQQDAYLVADKSEVELAKEEAKAKDEARFEERKQRRMRAAEEDDDTGPLIPKGKFLAAVIGLGLLYLAVNFADVLTTSRSSFEGEASAAVVLGAAQYDGEPSGALRGRLDRAAELYEEGLVENVVVTGGGQEADITTEAKTGYDYLRRNAGIPDEDLILEVQGTTTYEQLAAVSRILDQENTTDVVVVTDPYHARRSMLIANEVGLEAQAAVTDNRSDGTRLFSESVAISIGRLISFRRFDAYFN